MAASRAYLKWRDGALEAVAEGDSLTIRGSVEILLTPRSVAARPAKGHSEWEDSRKRYIYLHYDPLEPLLRRRRGNWEEGKAELGAYRVVRTDLGFEEFVTIVTPGSSFYDYVVVALSECLVVASRRRRAYVDASGGAVAVYFA